MRTTIYLDDHLAEKMKQEAARRGISLSAFLAESGRVALEEPAVQSAPFELVTHGAGGTFPGISLDRTSELLVAEDRQQYGESE